MNICEALALSACTIGWTMPPTDVVIHVHIMAPAAIVEARARLGGAKDDRLYGFAIPGSDTCAIFVPPLNSDGAVEIWRHEIRHCIEGLWHK
jgi:hypothetical protein